MSEKAENVGQHRCGTSWYRRCEIITAQYTWAEVLDSLPTVSDFDVPLLTQLDRLLLETIYRGKIPRNRHEAVQPSPCKVIR